MTSPSRISSRAGQRANERHDFGHGVRDVAKASRKDPHDVLRLVDLHSRAVELVLERRVVRAVRARPRRWLRTPRASAGSAASPASRRHRAPPPRRRAPLARRVRDRRPSSPRAGGVAQRPSPPARRPPGARLRARPGEAHRRAAGEGSRVRPRSRARTGARSTRARSPADPFPETCDSVANASSTSPTSSVALGGRRRVRCGGNGRVSDADPALPRRARQERHGRLDLAGLEPCEQIGEPVDLVQPAADARDIGRRRHELYEAHERS